MFAQELFLAYLYAKYNGMSANAISVFQVKRVKLPHLLMLSRHAFEQRWSGCYKLSRSGLCLSPWSFIWWPWLFGYLHLVPIWMLQGHEKNQVHYRKSDDSWSGNEGPIIMASRGSWKTWGEKEREQFSFLWVFMYKVCIYVEPIISPWSFSTRWKLRWGWKGKTVPLSMPFYRWDCVKPAS